MFGLRKLFSKQDKAKLADDIKPTVSKSSSLPIGFDPDLVGKLKDDHQKLISYFTTMIHCAQNADDKGVLDNLTRFKNLLTSHLITENTKLYMFLHYVYKNESDTHELVDGFRKEMVDIGKVVTGFIKKWCDASFNAASRAEFITEANGIAEALLRRITTEEERLYEIYEFSPTVLDQL